MLDYFPKFFSSKAITYYFASLAIVSVMFYNSAMPLIWILTGSLAVLFFLYFSNKLTQDWKDFTHQSFAKKLFLYALLIRVVWVVFSYFLYSIMVGTPFNFSAGDALGYHGEAEWLVTMIRQGNLSPYFEYIGSNYSDMGYPFYLGVLYSITDSSIFITRLLKALFSAWTVLLIYKIAVRNFGESVGRIAGVFTMLMPLLIFYTGLHLKEVEMLFLSTLFLERAEKVIRSSKANFIAIAILTLVTALIFLFRTVLGAAALFSLFTTLLFSNNRVTKTWKRIFVSIWVILAITFFLGGNIAAEVEQVWENRNLNQEQSMEWRSERQDGNAFAKYASATVFAPAIFIIPFPTMVNIDTQQNQMMFHGGYFIKNVMAFFVMFAFLILFLQKKWRENLLISSYVLAYLLIVAFSAFAQSERFHQPAIPIMMIFAAYGVSQFQEKHKKYFNYYLILLVVINVAWSWFKLAGRGLA